VCGNEGSQTAKRKDAVICPECGSSVTIKSDKDIVNEMFESADAYGTKIEMVSMDSEEGEMLMKAFSGLVAILRYRLGGGS
jgi:peptide chain release factor subunit 1